MIRQEPNILEIRRQRGHTALHNALKASLTLSGNFPPENVGTRNWHGQESVEDGQTFYLVVRAVSGDEGLRRQGAGEQNQADAEPGDDRAALGGRQLVAQPQRTGRLPAPHERPVEQAAGGEATAHKLARLVYSMVKHGTEYVDVGQDSYERQHRERVVDNLTRRAKELGFVLIPAPPQEAVT